MKKFLVSFILAFSLISIANAVTVNIYQKEQPLQVNVCRYNTDTQEINCPALEYKNKIFLGVNFYNMTETLFNYQFDIKFNGFTYPDNESYKFTYKDTCEVIDVFGLWVGCSTMEVVDSFCTINANVKLTDVNIFFDVNINKWIIYKPFVFKWIYYNHLGVIERIINNIGGSGSSSSSSSGSVSGAYSSSSSSSSVTVNVFNTQVPIQLPEEPLPPIVQPVGSNVNINTNTVIVNGVPEVCCETPDNPPVKPANVEVDKSHTKIIDNGPIINNIHPHKSPDTTISVEIGDDINIINGKSDESHGKSDDAPGQNK